MFKLTDADRAYVVRSTAEPAPRTVTVCAMPHGFDAPASDPRLRPFEPLWTGVSLPHAPTPKSFRSLIAATCPHMPGFIDWMAAELALQRSLSGDAAKLPPILLHGPPGVGKTYLAHAIAAALEIPAWLFNLAGNNDSATTNGASARYGTGGPSLPVQIMAQTRCATPAIILDEIDKVGHGSTNGRSTDGLLPFLEPVSARGVLDEFLLTPVDVSRVNWIATANDIRRIPRPLISRFACFEVTGAANCSGGQLLDIASRSLATDLGLDAGRAGCLFDPGLRRDIRLPRNADVRMAKALLRAALGEQFLCGARH